MCVCVCVCQCVNMHFNLSLFLCHDRGTHASESRDHNIMFPVLNFFFSNSTFYFEKTGFLIVLILFLWAIFSAIIFLYLNLRV